MRKSFRDDMELSLPAPSEIGRLEISTPWRHVSDGELLRRIADGDGRAFEQLYRRYARPVFGFALRRLGDHDRAEEAVQETFASVWRAARSYRPERGPGAPWLYGIARNAVVDRLRAQRPETAPETEDVPAAGGGPQEHAEAGWLAWRVHAAVEALPAAEREVLELAYWRGLSQSEVAESLRIPLGTVKTRTRSALRRLSELLDDEDVR